MLLQNRASKDDTDTRNLLSNSKFYESYSRWSDSKGRYETWDESVERVMNMHRKYNEDIMTPKLSAIIDEAEQYYKDKYVLGAQRALQFGGDQLLKHEMRMYNCTSSYVDRPEFFNELFYILLCGAGAGFSVQKHHVEKLPNISERKKQAKEFTPDDSIEGWSDSLAVLLSSYFVGGGVKPEYEGRKVYFNLSKIREAGSQISGGFKAPGPEPLRRALDKIEHLLQGLVLSGETRLRPIHAYDICMYIADAVLAGGVRRSATICLFSIDDQEMIEAKTGNWYVKNPQRGRSNNSAVAVRQEVTREQFSNLMKANREYGEPGFYFVSSREHTTNPCVEIGMFPQIDGQSGWQGCNLTEINGSKCVSKEEFFKACRAGSILGTLQAKYTNFKYLTETTKRIFEREALLGVSVTGWMCNPDVLFDNDIQREGAEIVKATNKEVAKMIGINPAARTTCVKPSGNASVLLQTPSGIHADHAPRYIRHVQMNKESEVAKLIAETNPYMIEESVWSSSKTDYSIAFPIIPKEGSLFLDDMKGIEFLDKVRQVQQNWVEYGTNADLCADDNLRHNVSNTVTVPPGLWDDVEKYIFENRFYFSGVSFLADTGDKDYNQAPNARVLTDKEIVDKYGSAALFASGLIVDTRKGFDNLWEATSVVKFKEDTASGEMSDQRSEWIRRFEKFSENYFDGDMSQTENCLKDVYYLHKWTKIQQNLVDIDFVSELKTKKFVDVDTLGAAACSGGSCEIEF